MGTDEVIQPALMGGDDLPALFAFDDAAMFGDRMAIDLRIGARGSHRVMTFAGLHRAVLAKARALYEHRCREGERVALLMPHGEPLIATFFAAIYSGLVPSILAWPTAKMDAEKYRRNLLGVVRGLAADWLVTDAATSATLGEALGQTRVIDVNVSIDAGDTPPPRLRRNGTAFIQFSGGTTGVQKSVPISFEHLKLQIESLASVLRVDDRDHVISWLPLYHDMGLIACLMMPFVMRIPVTMFAPMEWVMDPRPFLSAIAEQRATLCWQPNFAFSFLAARAHLPANLDLSSMRAFVNCSEPVRSASFDAFLNRFAQCGLSAGALQASYAMAEATFAVTQTTQDDPPRRLAVSPPALSKGWLQPGDGRVLVSSGRAIPRVEVRVVDPGGCSCAPAQIGEIWVRGPFIMEDYLDAPHGDGRPRQVFTDGYYRSGDLGALIDGHLFVTGRQKDLIIVGGVNIFPEDVESSAGDVPGVHAGRVVAFGIEGNALGTERLVVVAEVDTEEHLKKAVSLEVEIRKSVVAICGVAPDSVLIVPPKWIVKSTAGKISRIETKARALNHFSDLGEISRNRGV